MDDYKYKISQLERAIGELNALKVMFYEPSGFNREQYLEISKMIDEFTEELRNHI